MRSVIHCILAVSLLLTIAPRAFGACDLTAAELKNRRDGYDAACATKDPARGCTSPGTNHGQYVSCIAHEAKADATLPKQCQGAIVRCAAKSACGKPGFVTCCRSKSDGTTRCSTKRDSDHCVPPSGGTACVGNFSSCCDACTDSGCVPPPGP